MRRKSLLDGLQFICRVIPDMQVIYTANDPKLNTQKRYNKVLLYHTPSKTIQSRILLHGCW